VLPLKGQVFGLAELCTIKSYFFQLECPLDIIKLSYKIRFKSPFLNVFYKNFLYSRILRKRKKRYFLREILTKEDIGIDKGALHFEDPQKYAQKHAF